MILTRDIYKKYYVTYLEQYGTFLFEGELLTYLPYIYFTVYKIIADNKKTLIVGFFFAQTKFGRPYHTQPLTYFKPCKLMKLQFMRASNSWKI